MIADIPGLIEGAAEGAGLGHQFLRHLQRTGVLLHLVDLAPFDESVDPVAEATAIVGELRKYDEALYEKPRWLVLNKLDMVPEDERKARVEDFLERFEWDGPVFEISALTGQGCEALCYAIYDYLSEHSDAHRAAEAEDLAADVRSAMRRLRRAMQRRATTPERLRSAPGAQGVPPGAGVQSRPVGKAADTGDSAGCVRSSRIRSDWW